MTRSINKRFNKFIEDMDEEALTDSLREYWEEIYDLIFLKGDRKEAVERIEVISKFVDDHVHQHPDACFDGVFGAIGHLTGVLLFLYEYNRKIQAIMLFTQIQQMIGIHTMLDSYSETNDPAMLEEIQSAILKNIKNTYQPMDDECKKCALENFRKSCENDQNRSEYYDFITAKLEEINS